MHELEVHQIELEIQNEELIDARDALESGLARYTELFDFAPLGYVMVDAELTIRELNLAGAELLGAERARLNNLPFNRFVSPYDRTSFANLIARAITSETRESAELDLQRHTGVHVPARLTVKALPGPRLGSQLRLLIAIEDISARRINEQRLARTENALREADRRKDEFLAVLSHELRNPLTPIRNCVFILGRLAGEQASKNDAARRALAIIERQVSQLTRLIDDLLDVTRIGRGKIHLKKEHVELGDLMRGVIDDQLSSFDQSGIELECRISSRPLWVHADAARLTQVVSNLLGNAEKFTPRGGRVSAKLSAENERAVLRVVDNGAGIAPELVEHVFEPFAQAPQTMDRSRGGLGLGLSMVKGFVELHGGTVKIASSGPGRGTELTVTLPLEAAPPEVTRVESPAPDSNCRVLVIEDNEDAADTLGHALAIIGHDVQVAYDGQSGLELAHTFHPRVVICDIGLPGMDGYEVARAFRGDDELRNTFLIALTGYAQPEDLRRATAAGFDEHVAKPPSVGSLNRILSEAVLG